MDNSNKPTKKSRLAQLRPSKRRLIQVYAALLYNANIKGFVTGEIYTGVTKNLCVPGLNCYSCPGAVGACPLGSLQNALASSKTSSLAYVFGIIILFGLLLGRTVCGFLCPFGLIQELLNKIPSPKLKKNKFTRVFSYFKYILLVLLGIMLPLAFASKLAVPGFCKYICPDGILFGAIGLLLNRNNSEMFGMLGALFTWKFCLLIAFLASSVFIYRFFCRFFCPLGAIYGFFCRVALLGVKLDKKKCVSCGLCVAECKMDIRHVGDHECIHCGKCIPVCPTKAISWSGSRVFISDPTSAISKDGMKDQLTEEQLIKRTAKIKKRNTVLKITAVILALALLGTAIWYYNFRDVSEPKVSYGVGDECPDFTVKLIGSENNFTLSEAQGKIVIINFWATWCGPCVNELPHFEELSQAYPEQLTVIAIAEDSPDHAYLDEKGWHYCNFATDSDTACSGTSVFEAIGNSSSLPVTIVVDQSGTIIYRKSGSITYEGLLAAIAPALQNN